MSPRSNRIIVLLVGWLAALPAAAQAPSDPLPTSNASSAANASPYPTTSTPTPVYPSPAASAPTGSEIFASPDAPSAVEFPTDFGEGDNAGLLTPVEVGDDRPEWWKKACWLGPTPWDTGIELGLNGSSGTNESLSIRTGGYVKRVSRFSKLDLSAYYNNTRSGRATTQSNAQLDLRNDWLLDDGSPWLLFSTSTLFYDEFQAFDMQVNGQLGFGYRVADDPIVSLIARCGAGASREFGGPDTAWIPESLLGFEYGRRLSTTQKLYSRLEYFPEWDQVGQYRLVAEAGWEIELVQPTNMSLKMAANDRFDSTPEGADPHLVNYSVLLLLKL